MLAGGQTESGKRGNLAFVGSKRLAHIPPTFQPTYSYLDAVYTHRRCVLSADTRDSSNLVKSTDNCGNGFVPLFFHSCLLDSLMGAVVFRFPRLLRFTDDPMKSIFIGLRDFSVKHRTTVISKRHTRRLYQNFQVKIRVVERGQAFRGTSASFRI